MSQKFIPRRPRGYARIRAKPAPLPGELYQAGFLSASERRDLVAYLTGLRPIWEQRYSAHHPPPPGQTERGLLRPVYWLGTWQFACLDYYRPPKGLKNRAIEAEPFAPVLARLVEKIEALARERFPASDIPRGWTLNTGLVNYYGTRLEAGGKRHDVARVGEHRDFEPGPVASLSLGERALFQFVSSSRPGQRDGVASQTWLADGDLQVFGGTRCKKELFHRVQRVETKGGHRFDVGVEGFDVRRINLTLRWVPKEDVTQYAQLPADDRADVRQYMETLAKSSPFFARALALETPAQNWK